jgi:parvulin-like peptidyl-prolyl isomerase
MPFAIQKMISSMSSFGGSAAREQLLRSTLVVLAAAVLVSFGAPAAGSEEPEIVARVNGEAVTRGELDRLQADPLYLTQLKGKLDHQGQGDGEELERAALQNLIRNRLLVQEAYRRNFTVTGTELDRALSALRSRFGNLAEFGAWMHERGLDDRSLLDTLRDQILMTRVWKALVEGVGVSEEQVKEYFDAHQENLLIGEEVRLRVIAVREKAAAEEILALLQKGTDFGALARARSMGLLAAKGGDTGWVHLQSLPPTLRQAAGMLKAGDVVGPLEKTPEEYLLVGLADRRPLRAKSLAEARPEIERRLLAEKQQQIIEGWLAEQKRNSKVEVLL